MAVGLVLVFHAFPSVLPGGYIGVDVFFVISGYLITGIMPARCNGVSFRSGSSTAGAVRRIYPALAIVLLTAGLIGWYVLSPPELAELGKHVASAAFFIPNFSYWSESGYFDSAADQKPLLHLWSLGVEEQFYLVWPLTLFVLSRLRLNLAAVTAILTVVSFIACAVVVGSDQPAAGDDRAED